MNCRFNSAHERAIRFASIWGHEFSLRFGVPRWDGDHVVQLERNKVYNYGELEFMQAWAGGGLIRENHIYGGEDHYSWRFV